jgi:transmembrane 9 superfamily protein 2/4
MALLKLIVAACLAVQYATVSAFYMPGVKPQTFKEGDVVELKVNAITSIHTQIPKPYYRLPFCEPEGGARMSSESLGEFITGNKVQTSPYTIHMLQDMYCQKLCQKTITAMQARLLKSHISRAYHNNWIIDNLPSASVGSTEAGQRQKHYAGGFPLGFIDIKSKPVAVKNRRGNIKRGGGDTGDAYVFNHVNIILDYHQPEGSNEGYRVVGFSVEPMSIDHAFMGGFEWDGESQKGISTPLATCTNLIHMTRDSVQKNQIVEAGAKILYTYDVIWKASPVAWSSRWDVYLNEEGLVPPQVHWYSISNSIFIVVFLSLLIISVLVRNLKKDIANYNAIASMAADEEGEEDYDESGWKLVHADVFRPPSNFPMLYCVFVGSGAQLAVSTTITIGLAAVGFLNPSRRGSMMNATLVCFMLCGILAGYVSSRLYKAFRGRSWQLCTVCTAILFPGMCFGIFLFFNTVLAFYHSSGSAPFLDILILAAMWCCVSIPLVFIGAFFGYKKEAIHFPTVTSTIARAIPEPHIMINPKVSMLLAGIIPFSSAYVELFFIMSSLWMDQYYYVFGFTFIVFFILLLSCSEIAVLLVYYQLVNENHRWWWFALISSGSVSFFFFAYSIVWFGTLEASKMFFTYLLYFGYMFLMCFAIFLVTGAVGSLVCLWFVRKIFSAIKVD